MEGIEILAEPQLSLFAFRLSPRGWTSRRSSTGLNQRLLERVNARQRVVLTGHELRGPLRPAHLRPLLPHPPRPAWRMALEDLEADAGGKY